MLVPMIASEDDFPPLNSQKKIEKFCTPIITKLNNESKCKNIFRTAMDIIDKSGVDIENKQVLKSKSMTDKVLAAYKGQKI